MPFVGHQIRLARRKKGLTQEELADLMSLHPSAVCKHELGTRKVDLVTLKKYALVLGKPISFFLNETKE